jgi:DUF971 family protein
VKGKPLPIFGQPDPTTVRDVHLVGRYALGVTWADEHGSIFPFVPLRRDCDCGVCAGAATLAPPMTWPQQIKREPAGLAVVWSDGHASLYPWAALRARCRCAACTGGH